MCKIRIFFANFFWLLSCLPGLANFLYACLRPRIAQEKVVLRQGCGPYEDCQGNAVPMESAGLACLVEQICRTGNLPSTGEKIIQLVPTSGTSSAAKLVPYSQSFIDEIRRGIDPWIACLYICCPSLLFGRQYWALSPNTRPPPPENSAVPVGFADDSAYLGAFQRKMAGKILIAPPEISLIDDRDSFDYVTLLFMVKEKNLRLISVWHPSYLTRLLDSWVKHRNAVIAAIASGCLDSSYKIPVEIILKLEKLLCKNPGQAEFLSSVRTDEKSFPLRIWKDLRVISCWTDGMASGWVDDLKSRFPGVRIQGKGLLATEGIVSIPIGFKLSPVMALRSHFLEFEDRADGSMHPAWDLKKGHEYGVMLTNSAGLKRYKMNDVVRVDGFFMSAPRIRFIGRDSTSDLVGEKLSSAHVEEILDGLRKSHEGDIQFAMISPFIKDDMRGYVLYLQTAGMRLDFDGIRNTVEEELSKNYHYLHAINRKQISALQLFLISGNAEEYFFERSLKSGTRLGDIKFTSLSRFSDWERIFPGKYL
ncbi:MAG: GH3 auxin-responsive promoter family protein [Victivallales bacterium]